MSYSLKIKSFDANGKSQATKTFQVGTSALADDNSAAKALAESYRDLTNAAATTAQIVTTEDLELE